MFLGFSSQGGPESGKTRRMPAHKSKSEKREDSSPLRRDPYEVLGVNKYSTDQEIKTAYRKLALKYVYSSFLSLFLNSLLFQN